MQYFRFKHSKTWLEYNHCAGKTYPGLQEKFGGESTIYSMKGPGKGWWKYATPSFVAGNNTFITMIRNITSSGHTSKHAVVHCLSKVRCNTNSYWPSPAYIPFLLELYVQQTPNLINVVGVLPNSLRYKRNSLRYKNKTTRTAQLHGWKSSFAMPRGVSAVFLVVLAGFAASRKWSIHHGAPQARA